MGRQAGSSFHEGEESLIKRTHLEVARPGQGVHSPDDASDVGIGACLLQQYEGVKHPVLYASKKLLGRERNYPVGEREALAIVWAVQKMHRFLYGEHFVLETDHRPLQYLNSAHSKSPRLMRWSLALQPYHFTIRYIRGEDNFCADYLSRGCAADTE